MNEKTIADALQLLGVDEERIKRIKETVTFNFGNNPKEDMEFNIDNYKTLEEKHTKMLSYMEKTLSQFENCDIVECDTRLLNDDMVEIIWKNINVYSYDIETFFLNKFEFHLKDGNEIIHKMYFSLENDNIFLYVKTDDDVPFVGGAIIIRDGKFLPAAALNDVYYPNIVEFHKKERIPFDREFAANRTLLNSFLYILLVNQMITLNKEVITETSRRIDVTKKKKSNKKVQKRTKQIRYIKVDEVKVRKVKEEYERTTRESYNRHVAEWSRRGYWTTLRNGKKHWVKPTTCHAKDKVETKIENKIYKLV